MSSVDLGSGPCPKCGGDHAFCDSIGAKVWFDESGAIKAYEIQPHVDEDTSEKSKQRIDRTPEN